MDASNAKPEWAQSKREKDNVERVAKGLRPRRRRWPWIVLIIVVLAVVAVFLLMRSAPVAPAPVVADPGPPVMQVNPTEITTIAPQLLQETIKVTGSLMPEQQTEIASQLAGRVVTVLVKPGDAVEAGDILVQIDTQSLQIQLAQQRDTAEATRAQLTSADAQLQRTLELFQGGLTSSSAMEQAQSGAEALRANLAALEGQVAAAELALKNATVVAPFTGIVSARSVDPGQTVGAGAPLLTIVDLTRVELQAAAPVGSSARIAEGQAVSILVDGLADTAFEGIVARVNPVALSGTRTIPVYITLDNPDGVLRGGMFATGQIVVGEQRDALAVPEAAVREDAEGFFLLKLEGDGLVRQAIEQGRAWNRGRMVEIVSGLAIGDVVVTAPLTQLQPGDKIAMVEG